MIKFLGKSETLILLKKKFPKHIPNLNIFSTNDFIKNPEIIYRKIKKNFTNKVAIRSTYKSEDSEKYSNAGKYYSSLNVNVNNKNSILELINKTINSYEKKKDSKFFVQEMVEDVSISGVCLTKSLNNILPYFEINFNKGNQTDIVTSGKSNVQNLVYFPNNRYSIKKKKIFKVSKNYFQTDKNF